MLEINSSGIIPYRGYQSLVTMDRLLHVYLQPCIIILGVFGNCCSITVMRQTRYRKSSDCFYMTLLAVFDNFILVGVYLLNYLKFVNPKWPAVILYCRMLLLFVYSTFGWSNCTLLAMTFDRFVAICFPMRARLVCTKRRAKVYVVIMFSTLLAYALPNLFWGSSIRRRYDAYPVCFFIPPSVIIQRVYDTVYLVAMTVLPLIVLAVLNACIVVTIRTSSSTRRRLTIETTDHTPPTVPQAQITFMLLLVTHTFIILHIPYLVIFLLIMARKRPSTLLSSLFSISKLILSLNPMINFYVYCLGGRKFRKDFSKLFCCQK
ncbi:thyrotropin-releasing hormone receptor-like [Tubulanus polymorphus]|uniref:thyrotropin-releasing hormone receptor-like n=1 Tax=Tubulanus polymorphus TaxID=672921 RepID=UPI003DA4B07B